jgi:hypothetical protein
MQIIQQEGAYFLVQSILIHTHTSLIILQEYAYINVLTELSQKKFQDHALLRAQQLLFTTFMQH